MIRNPSIVYPVQTLQGFKWVKTLCLLSAASSGAPRGEASRHYAEGARLHRGGEVLPFRMRESRLSHADTDFPRWFGATLVPSSWASAGTVPMPSYPREILRTLWLASAGVDCLRRPSTAIGRHSRVPRWPHGVAHIPPQSVLRIERGYNEMVKDTLGRELDNLQTNIMLKESIKK